MGSTSYNSKLRDNRWQKKRLEVMNRDKWTCRCCGVSGDGVVFNVHHAYYESGKAPWEYPTDSLVTWCESCHKLMHGVLRKINISVCNMDKADALSAADSINALVCEESDNVCWEFMDVLREEWPALCDRIRKVCILTPAEIYNTKPLFADSDGIVVAAESKDIADQLNNMGRRFQIATTMIVERIIGRKLPIRFAVEGGAI